MTKATDRCDTSSDASAVNTSCGGGDAPLSGSGVDGDAGGERRSTGASMAARRGPSATTLRWAD